MDDDAGLSKAIKPERLVPVWRSAFSAVCRNQMAFSGPDPAIAVDLAESAKGRLMGRGRSWPLDPGYAGVLPKMN